MIGSFVRNMALPARDSRRIPMLMVLPGRRQQDTQRDMRSGREGHIRKTARPRVLRQRLLVRLSGPELWRGPPRRTH